MNKDSIYKVTKWLNVTKIVFRENVNLKEFSYFRSGGQVKLLVIPSVELQLQQVVRYMADNEYEYKIVGDTSNLMFLDDHDYGILICLSSLCKMQYDSSEGTIYAEAGASLPELSRKALLWGITGFEGLEGIPGSIGGGLFMNAGAYDSEIKDCLISVDGYCCDGSSFSFSAKEVNAEYRNSFFREHAGKYIITSAMFRAQGADPQSIFEKMELYHAKRHKYQDFLYPSLGSLFSIRDIYRALGHNDSKYLIFLKLLRSLFFSKKTRRETPINRTLLNRFVCYYFGWEFDQQPFSDKTLNCLANRGQHTDVFIEYIRLLKDHLPESARLENEIVETCYYTDK